MSQAQTSQRSQLLYFADPMCSWCWGFAPVIEAIERDYAESITVLPVAGGLRAGETRPMNAKTRQTIQEHWKHVAEASGQAFLFDGAMPDGFVYDTEPSCRALVTVRSIEPAKALGFLKAMQGAFYRDGADITTDETLVDLAQANGIDRSEFLTQFNSADINQATRADFALTMENGVSGFPTLILDAGGQKRIISMGYQPLDAIKNQIERRLT